MKESKINLAEEKKLTSVIKNAHTAKEQREIGDRWVDAIRQRMNTEKSLVEPETDKRKCLVACADKKDCICAKRLKK